MDENKALVKGGTTIEEAIEEVGIGKTQYILLVITGLTFCSDAAEVTFLSYVTEVLRCEWGLTAEQESLMSSVVFVGMMVGAPLWGYLADHSGRRLAFLASSIVICVFGFLTAACSNAIQLVIVRAIVGFGVAGLPIGFDILAEALPVAGRGKFLLYIECFWTFGSIYVNFCAWKFLESYGWRFFTCLAALPTLLASVSGYYLLPESPRWLHEMGEEAKAIEIVNTWIKANGHSMQVESLVEEHHQEMGWTALFARRKLRFVTLVMAYIWFAFGMGYYGIVMLLPRVYGTDSGGGGGEEAEAGSPCSQGMNFDFQDLGYSVAAEILGVVAATLLIDKPGRVGTQAIFYILGGACGLVLSFKRLPRLLLVCTGSVARMAEMAACCSTWVQTPELFPTQVRTTAHGVLNSCSRVGAFLAPWLISGILPDVGRDFLTGMLVMGLVSMSAGAAALALPETAGIEMHDADFDSTEISDEDNDDSMDGDEVE